MRQIVGYPLWIGTARDARDPKTLLAAGIEAVVDLAMEEQPASPPRELIAMRFPLVDGAGNPPWLLCAAVGTTQDLIRLRVPTLIACGGGMSRSPAVAAAAAWFRTPDVSVGAVLKAIKEGGPTDVHPGLWADIKHCVFTLTEAVYKPREQQGA